MAAFRIVALALAATALAVAPALACGGFFCDRGLVPNPINQAGEKILFLRDGGQLTAYVQVSYQGNAHDFSWVVPVPAQPTVGVSSDEVFTRLEAATRVSYQLQYGNLQTCGRFANTTGGFVPTAAAGALSQADGVAVVSRQLVGPYDVAVLKADTTADLKAWLDANGYGLPPRFDQVTASYVKGGSYFAAFKLRQDRGTGDLAPIVLSYASTEPCIPLILTSIAATPNMPITAYVLGPARAVPTNYEHVRINEGLIDWVGGGANYNALVTQAVGEAGGRAFVTDLATKSSAIQTSLQVNYQLSGVRSATTAFDALMAVQGQGFPRTQQLESLLQRDLPAVASVSVSTGGDPYLVFPIMIRDQLSVIPVDASASAQLATDLDTTFVQPLVKVHDAFGRVPYLTRFYTTMSPDKMTVDPLLDFNPALPDVSNVRTAKADVTCDGSNAITHVTLNDGTTFQVAGSPVAVAGMPAAALIEQLDTTSAQGNPLVDNRSRIASLLAKYVPTVTQPGCACSNPAGGSPAPLKQGAGEGAVYGLAYLAAVGGLKLRRGGGR